jgi:glucose-6-phosphate 1-epimerase
MAQHGFVRNSKWRYIDAINGDDTITAYFVLTNADVSTSWSFLFTNVFEVTLSADSLSYSMRIFNTDSREFSYQTLLHTYIRTPRIEEISISGVQNWEFYDKVDNNSKKLQTDSNIFIASEVDRVYVGESQNPANPNIKLMIHHQPTNSIYLTSQSYASLSNYDSSLLNLLSKESLPTFEINIKGLESKPQISDVVVWNAWEAKCKALDDLDDDAYFHYVCIEPGLVAKQHFLGPNQMVCMTQSLF